MLLNVHYFYFYLYFTAVNGQPPVASGTFFAFSFPLYTFHLLLNYYIPFFITVPIVHLFCIPSGAIVLPRCHNITFKIFGRCIN